MKDLPAELRDPAILSSFGRARRLEKADQPRGAPF